MPCDKLVGARQAWFPPKPGARWSAPEVWPPTLEAPKQVAQRRRCRQAEYRAGRRRWPSRAAGLWSLPEVSRGVSGTPAGAEGPLLASAAQLLLLPRVSRAPAPCRPTPKVTTRSTMTLRMRAPRRHRGKTPTTSPSGPEPLRTSSSICGRR